jgi:hypothetical protein
LLLRCERIERGKARNLLRFEVMEVGC